MNSLLTAADIEARAKAAGLSIPEVCKRADIAISTFWRWKAGKTEPGIGVYQRLVSVTDPATVA